MWARNPVWRCALLVLLLCWGGRSVAARDIPVQTCLARLVPGQSVAVLLAHPRRFVCAARQTPLGNGDFVADLRFAPVAASGDSRLVLRSADLWQQAEQIRFRYADGRERWLTVSAADSAGYLTLGAVIEVPVPPRPSPLTGVVIVTQGSANLRGVVLGARLMSQTAAFAVRLADAALYAAFAGLALALCIYNLALWQALRNRLQLYYCLMVAGLGAYAFTASGALIILAPAIANDDRMRINYIMLAASALAGVWFVRSFFAHEVPDPWLARAFRWAGGATMASALAFAVLAPWQIGVLDRIYVTSVAVLLALLGPLLLVAWRRRARYFGVFMAAWALPLGLAALRIAYGFGLLPYSFWLDNGNLLAMAAEALLSAPLVTARVRQLSQERDHARRGERLARRLASTDSLTGLLNRRAFLDLAIGRRAQQRLMLIDIDHFKAVNDHYGHEVGDQVLIAVAEAIQSCRPARSLAVRLGGEEFGLLVPHSSAAKYRAETLLAVVRDKVMPQGLKVTVSIGMSEGRLTTHEDWRRLYRLADAALYRAKADGRDRLCRATDFRVAAG